MDPRRLGIAGSDDWIDVMPLLKGFSSDMKYKITTSLRGSFLLRTFALDQLPRKLDEYRVMMRLHEAGIAVNPPVDLGPCTDQKTGYLMGGWIEGEDLETVLPHLSERKQRQLGEQAGRLLASVHALAPLHPLADWAAHYNAKLDRKIQNAIACPVDIPGMPSLISVIETSRNLLTHRPITLHHGDFHLGNLLVQPDGKLALIDLNRYDAGDPWEEFNRIVWDAQASANFASGRIEGYFPHGIPDTFFPLMRLYIAANALSSVPWAIPFGAQEIAVMQNQLRDIQTWYTDMTRLVPSWYTPSNKNGS
jgi:aminoglycoside phosphotransferase (APT) family kinase protein